jgi:hypothetical protein
VEVIGARRSRTKVKRRKAHGAGKLAPSSEAQYPAVAPGVVATGLARTVLVLPEEVWWVPPRR